MKLDRFVLPLALLAAFLVAAIAGLPQVLGAHPWWAAKTGVIGSLIGAVAFGALVWSDVRRHVISWLAVAGLLASAATATLGKRAFVASMAENALVGRFWFFGWFAIWACLYLLVASLVLRIRR